MPVRIVIMITKVLIMELIEFMKALNCDIKWILLEMIAEMK